MLRVMSSFSVMSLRVEDALQPLRGDRQLRDGAGHADGGFHRGGDHGADRRDAAFAGALDAERVEWARRFFGEDDLDLRRLARGRHDVVGKARGERIAALAVDEFLVEGAAETLREAAGDLSLD